MADQSKAIEEYLLGALKRLLKKKTFDEISITELTKVAGISRMTFYRHYQNITDILTNEMAEIVNELTDKLGSKTVVQHEGLVFIMQFLKDHASFIRILLLAQQQDILRDNISQVLAKLSANKKKLQNLNAREIDYYVRYHSTGLTSVIIDWVTKKQPETPEELATFLEKIGEGSQQS
ncbi:hypothetical protein AYR56_01515 [Loigolactobacillus backii]|uniref:HTH tetR-type domain-containing protein n=1 Tax=Loigolactobacillus backii TaxID=375175 RepID=A0A192GZA6_9LACO|nr:TetR/AcrR family transcriptional regulator [Loigolactobacillus backii]ANK61864.1 hypothetical protein AYR53_03210 [Loigolactobacillus backii]ANK68942.1 hypothetical protein AYR56_01515 [Loigolactobacillus backii]